MFISQILSYVTAVIPNLNISIQSYNISDNVS